MMRPFIARGLEGRWFSRIDWDDISVPCVWHRRRHRNHYYDPAADPDDPKWRRLAAAIEEHKRVLVILEKIGKTGNWERRAYVGIWTVDNVKFTKLEGLQFDLIEQIGYPGAKIPGR
jgi:hypothetical protein